MKFCSNCGKPLSNENPNFCDNCGAQLSDVVSGGQNNPLQPGSNDKEEKNPYLALLCSFFIPGLGQVYNGSAAKGIGFFFGTVIGLVFFIIPGLVVWIINISDAYSTAKKMNTGEIAFIPTKTAHLILFLILVVFIISLVSILVFVFFLAMITASIASLTHPSSSAVHTSSSSVSYPVYSAPVRTTNPIVWTTAPVYIPPVQHGITDGFWCRDTTVNIGKAPTEVTECYQFSPDGTFKWGYSPGWPMGKSPSCSGESGAKCTYFLNGAGKYEVQGGYIFTLSGDLLIDAHNPPYYRWSASGIP